MGKRKDSSMKKKQRQQQSANALMQKEIEQADIMVAEFMEWLQSKISCFKLDNDGIVCYYKLRFGQYRECVFDEHHYKFKKLNSHYLAHMQFQSEVVAKQHQLYLTVDHNIDPEYSVIVISAFQDGKERYRDRIYEKDNLKVIDALCRHINIAHDTNTDEVLTITISDEGIIRFNNYMSRPLRKYTIKLTEQFLFDKRITSQFYSKQIFGEGYSQTIILTPMQPKNLPSINT